MADSDPETTVPAPQRRAGWRALPLLVVALAAGVYALTQFGPDRKAGQPYPAEQGEAVPGKTVSLEIDFGDGRRKQFPALSWREGFTVNSALDTAERQEGETIFHRSGSGPTAFLSGIDGCQNEGSGAESRNWIYYVNGKRGKKSFALFELEPQDKVLWKFETYE